MYIELKTGFNDDGPAWIGRVRFSKTGRTIFYRGRELREKAGGESVTHQDVVTLEDFWVSGVKGRRRARLWADRDDVEIDDDAREEYERLSQR